MFSSNDFFQYANNGIREKVLAIYKSLNDLHQCVTRELSITKGLLLTVDQELA